MRPFLLSAGCLLIICMLCSCGATKYTYHGSFNDIAQSAETALYTAKKPGETEPLLRKPKTDKQWANRWFVSGDSFIAEYSIRIRAEKAGEVSIRIHCHLGSIFSFIRQKYSE